MRHELTLLQSSVNLPGLATLDVTKMLVPPS